MLWEKFTAPHVLMLILTLTLILTIHDAANFSVVPTVIKNASQVLL